jgi:FkbM family methyltransferase
MPFGVSWTADLRHYTGQDSVRTVFDVGAHRGETALEIAEAFPGAQIHCFEPVRPNFRALVAATGRLDVRCVDAAVSDTDGIGRFHLGPDSGRCGFRAIGPGLDVRTITLDTYAAEAGVAHVDLLKIDTEGHEAAVLAGARRLLTTGRVNHVLAECDFTARPDEPHGDFAEILRLLAPLGFRVVSFYTGGVDELGWRWGDVLLRRVTASRASRVAVTPAAEGAAEAGG